MTSQLVALTPPPLKGTLFPAVHRGQTCQVRKPQREARDAQDVRFVWQPLGWSERGPRRRSEPARTASSNIVYSASPAPQRRSSTSLRKPHEPSRISNRNIATRRRYRAQERRFPLRSSVTGAKKDRPNALLTRRVAASAIGPCTAVAASHPRRMSPFRMTHLIHEEVLRGLL